MYKIFCSTNFVICYVIILYRLPCKNASTMDMSMSVSTILVKYIVLAKLGKFCLFFVLFSYQFHRFICIFFVNVSSKTPYGSWVRVSLSAHMGRKSSICGLSFQTKISRNNLLSPILVYCPMFCVHVQMCQEY